jgi:anaerobic dimethyl sulfoxide reductase subunit A
VYTRDGRITHITSAGDIPRQGSEASDEDLHNIQRRACIKGFVEKNRTYSPMRLQFPMKQTIERGKMSGFVRITWEEALDTVTLWYHEMLRRMDDLGYMPMWEKYGVGRYLGPTLNGFGNPSSGNGDAALFVAFGGRIPGAPVRLIEDAKMVLIWGKDIQATLANLPFYLTKAKESGVPVCVIDSRYTATAAQLATDTSDFPGFIGVRPGTDGAMLSAMANVIYRRNLHDEAFIRSHCFGFYPDDTIVSQSTGKDPLSKTPYAGLAFTTPKGQSFVEYLDQLEAEHGGYMGVLDWAESITGVKSADIERLAIAYATKKPAYIFQSMATGPQRTQYGMYFCWLLICLSAMTGNLVQRGGSFGMVDPTDGYRYTLPEGQGPFLAKPYAPVAFGHNFIDDVILKGRDARTPEQLRADVLSINGIDIGSEGRLHLEMLMRGPGTYNTFNQNPNINRRRFAWQKLKHIVGYETEMTAMAQWSDIVLPTILDFERTKLHMTSGGDIGLVQGVIDPLFDCRTDEWINYQLAKRLGIPVVEDYDFDGVQAEQWKLAEPEKSYTDLYPSYKKPLFEDLKKKAIEHLGAEYEKIPTLNAYGEPGRLANDTGRINFYSPYLQKRERTKAFRAQYVPLDQGYESTVGKMGPDTPLQFVTPHVAHRSNTLYDELPMLRDQFPHGVSMHPDDAKLRGIAHGDLVYAYSQVGCIRVRAQVSMLISPGVVAIPQGVYYRPSDSEFYDAVLDLGNGPESVITPVDWGGNPNTITINRAAGMNDPLAPGCLGLHANGGLCWISKENPMAWKGTIR